MHYVNPRRIAAKCSWKGRNIRLILAASRKMFLKGRSIGLILAASRQNVLGKEEALGYPRRIAAKCS
jgi:hypothetical protein